MKGKIEYREEHVDHHHGQDDMELGLYIDDEIIGMVQYTLFNGELTVRDIIVRPEFRRQGYGSRMMKYIKQIHPEYKYVPSLKTDLGAKFVHKDIDLNELRKMVKEVLFESFEKNISDIVLMLTKKYNDEYGVSCDLINQGDCENFAEELHDILKEVGIESEILSDGLFFDPFGDLEDNMMWDVSQYGKIPTNFKEVGLPSHYWVYVGGKHYDSDAPNGVSDMFELPIIKDFYLKKSKLKSEEVEFQDDSDEEDTWDRVRIIAKNKDGKKVGYAILDMTMLPDYEFNTNDEDSREYSDEELEKHFPDEYSIAKLEHLEVYPEFKQMGFGKELMDAAVKYVKERGYSTMYLLASPIGVNAIDLEVLTDFYKKYGFEIIKDYGNSRGMVSQIGEEREVEGINDKTKMSIFDFDKTLVMTPEPEEGMQEWKDKTGKQWEGRWWENPNSLNTDIFEMPVNSSVISAYNKEKSNPNNLIVMMTGRIKALSKYVEKVLDMHGLKFEDYLYKDGAETSSDKMKKMELALKYNPNIREIEMWDDRDEHIPIFKNWGNTMVDMGYIDSFKINHVKGGHINEIRKLVRKVLREK